MAKEGRRSAAGFQPDKELECLRAERAWEAPRLHGAVRGDVPGPRSLLAMKANPRNVPGGRLQVARDHMDQGGPQIQ